MYELNEKECANQSLVKAFTKTVTNPITTNTSALRGWLASLEETSLYKSLIDAAEAASITE